MSDNQPTDASQPINFGVPVDVQTTSLVGYQSRGHCLVIADLEHGLDVCEALQTAAKTLLVPDTAAEAIDKQATESGLRVITARVIGLHGYLGAYDCRIGSDNEPGSLAKIAGVSLFGGFDHVLNLSSFGRDATPLISAEVPPFGYFAPLDQNELDAAMQELAELEGEFEKPKYFEYNPDICAHSRSGIVACTNCLDVCGTGAITTAGEKISVEPYLCQGCGSCTSNCPSGAIRYAYPAPADALLQLAGLLEDRRKAGFEKTVVFLHDVDEGASRLEQYESALSDVILPVAVEEVGSIGIDGWFGALAYGAAAVVIDKPADGGMLQALSTQLTVANQILAGIGLSGRLMFSADNTAEFLNSLAKNEVAALQPASFQTFNDKRQTTRTALDHLLAQTGTEAEAVALDAGAPFGEVQVNTDACTLCLACVTVCPGRALQDGETKPQLKLIESACLQCGLCEKACPENAISLNSRYLLDSQQARAPRVLNEQTPFNCIVCNTPFATLQIIGRMQAQLSGHWMFEDEKALRRLKMCEDCRVKDIFECTQGGIDVHKSDDQTT
jgi:ferredoxin